MELARLAAGAKAALIISLVAWGKVIPSPPRRLSWAPPPPFATVATLAVLRLYDARCRHRQTQAARTGLIPRVGVLACFGVAGD